MLTPGDRAGPPAPRRAAGLASPSTEAEERARPTSGSAWDAGALGTRRAGAQPPVQVHPRAWSPRRWERVPFAAPSPESSVARRSWEPSSRPSWLRWAAGLQQGPGPGPTAADFPSPTWRLLLEKKSDFLSTLLRGESGLSRKLLERPACAFALRPRSAEEKQLPPKSCLPLPPKAPRRFVRRVRDLQSICLRGRKMSVTVPNERRVFFS